MIAMLLLVSHGGPCHFSLAIISLLWVQCITGRPKRKMQRKGSKHHLVTAALLICMLRNKEKKRERKKNVSCSRQWFTSEDVMVMSCFKNKQKHNLCSAFLGKNPSLTGCNQNDIGLRQAAIACTFLSCQDIEAQVELPLHRETSYAGARLAFGGKKLQHHAVVSNNKT